MFMEENYRVERESREKRLAAYAEKIQEYTLEQSKMIINESVEERHRQNMTQQELRILQELCHRTWQDLKVDLGCQHL